MPQRTALPPIQEVPPLSSLQTPSTVSQPVGRRSGPTGKAKFISNTNKVVTINLLSKPLVGIYDSNAESMQSHGQSTPTTARSGQYPSQTSPRYNASMTNPSPKRITNAQMQWRMALQRPATCEKNMKDLDSFREENAATRRQQYDIIDEEAVGRRHLDIGEGELREVISSQFQKLSHYLARLALSEQVKKATVDKHNDKIHNLFRVAQSDDRQRREKAKKDSEYARQTRIETDKLLSAQKLFDASRETVLLQRERQEELASMRQETKEIKAHIRLQAFHQKREQAAMANVEASLRSLKREANSTKLANHNREQVSNARKSGLPIHSFLRLPPLHGSPHSPQPTDVEGNNESTTSSSSSPFTTTNNKNRLSLPRGFSLAARSSMNRKRLSPYDVLSDDDPYGILDRRTYSHTRITLSDDDHYVEGEKTTQTNANWMDTLPTDDDDDDERVSADTGDTTQIYSAALEASQTLVLSAIEAAVQSARGERGAAVIAAPHVLTLNAADYPLTQSTEETLRGDQAKNSSATAILAALEASTKQVE